MPENQRKPDIDTRLIQQVFQRAMADLSEEADITTEARKEIQAIVQDSLEAAPLREGETLEDSTPLLNQLIEERLNWSGLKNWTLRISEALGKTSPELLKLNTPEDLYEIVLQWLQTPELNEEGEFTISVKNMMDAVTAAQEETYKERAELNKLPKSLFQGFKVNDWFDSQGIDGQRLKEMALEMLEDEGLFYEEVKARLRRLSAV